jgi:uncharacterized membrane protein YidH (DUF202 family)
VRRDITRTTLAVDRTVLAYLRTAVAMAIAGVLVAGSTGVAITAAGGVILAFGLLRCGAISRDVTRAALHDRAPVLPCQGPKPALSCRKDTPSG